MIVSTVRFNGVATTLGVFQRAKLWKIDTHGVKRWAKIVSHMMCFE